MAETTAPRSFGYAEFIEDLEPLIEVGRKFDGADCRHDSQTFKAWKHEVLDLIHRIERQRYSINCQLSDRIFQVPSYGHVTKEEQRHRFEQELGDTLHELDVVVGNFRKYGDPKEAAVPAARVLAQRLKEGGSSESDIANVLRSSGTPPQLIEQALNATAQHGTDTATAARPAVMSEHEVVGAANGKHVWPEKPTLPELIKILPISAYAVLASTFLIGLSIGSYPPYSAGVARWAESVEAKAMGEKLSAMQEALGQTQKALAEARALAAGPSAPAHAASR